jgi:purine nucleosidase
MSSNGAILMALRVILDTDIGTDVDDCLALALILSSPELQLEGVTCVYGDVGLRARMARKLLRLRGRDDIPVTVGASKPLLDRRPVYWPGHEGKGLLEEGDETLESDSEFATDFIIRKVIEYPGEIHLICIGPLTNIALSFLREPRLAQRVAGLTIMGGVLRGPQNLDLPYAEHNIISDPEAAHVVLSSGAPITLIPLDITTQVRINRQGVASIRSGQTTFHEAVARQVELYPHFQAHDWTFLHDPLAVATLIDPTVVTMRPLHIDVELGGTYTPGATLMRIPKEKDQNPINVCLEVDVARFEAFLPARLAT